MGFYAARVDAAPGHVMYFDTACMAREVLGAHRRPRAFDPSTSIRTPAELEPGLGPTGDLHALGDWANKLPGTVAQIAGLPHIGDRGTDGLSRMVERTRPSSEPCTSVDTRSRTREPHSA